MSSSFQSLLHISLFFGIFYISFNGLLSSASATQHESSSSPEPIHLEMIHRHSARLLGEKTLNHSESMNQLLHADKARLKSILQKIRHGGDNSSFSLPIRSGSYANLGMYYVTLKVGTPAQMFLVTVDTGSSLTWVDCSRHPKYRKRCPKGQKCRKRNGDDGKKYGNIRRRYFHPERSLSFRPIPCSTKLCRRDLLDLFAIPGNCPKPKSPCTYEYHYADGDYVTGNFAHESVTVTLANGKKKKIHDMLIGCTKRIHKDNPDTPSGGDGIFGLGTNYHSFGPSIFNDFHGKFSYCFMDRWSGKRETNYLTFGNRSPGEMPPNMQYTELGTVADFYALQIEGIYVDGVKLNIPPSVWDFGKGKGTIIDSGSTSTYWVEGAYEPIMAALDKNLARHFQRAPETGPFTSCFVVHNTDKNGNEIPIPESLAPRFEIQFKGGVRFKPPVKSYVIYINENLNCIGFLPAPPPPPDGSGGLDVSIIGNILQQNHMWEFDPFRNRLGFAHSTCELRHHHRF